MFFPAKYQKKIIFILRCLTLPFVMLLLAVTISQAQAMSTNDLLFSNLSSEVQQSDSEPLYDLTLSYRCDNNSDQYWTVTNSNGFEMTFDWFLESENNGTVIIPAYGSYTMQTENGDQTVTIKYSFPIKAECHDEKCGETEIIKLTATSTICEVNLDEVRNSPQEAETSNNPANTTHNFESHDSELYLIAKQESGLMTFPKLSLDRLPSKTFFGIQRDTFTNLIAAGLVFYPGYQYEQIS